MAFGSGEVSAELQLDDDFPFFNGHFPNDPILPAVCIIDGSLALLSQYFPQLSMENVHLKRCRFAATVRPKERIQIRGTETSKGTWKFQWLGQSESADANDGDLRSMAELNVLI